MVIIKFRNGSDWRKANWVYRQLISDTIAESPNDAALKERLEMGQVFGTLFVDKMEPNTAIATLQILIKVAENTIMGTVLGWKGTKPEDTNGQAVYIDSIKEFLDLAKADIRVDG